jgi:hypothetical protein
VNVTVTNNTISTEYARSQTYSFYLTLRELWPKTPNPRRGGKERQKEVVQMKIMVNMVEQGVERGN